MLLVLFAVGMVGLLVWYCLGILTGSVTVSGTSPAVTAEAQKWAMAILGAIASGLIGFLTGKAIEYACETATRLDDLAGVLALPSPAD